MIDWNDVCRQIGKALEKPMLDIYNGQRRLIGLPALTLDEYRMMQLERLAELKAQEDALLCLINEASQPDDVMQDYVDYLYRKE